MENYSESLKHFRQLIKKDYKRINSKKGREEKRDLLDWFVDNCPANDGPEMAKKFVDYGITSSYDCKRFKIRIIENIGLVKGDTYICFDSGNKMDAMIDKIEILYFSRRKPIIFFSKGKHGEIDSLYIRIRNSFAHGNYFKIRNYYYLWNETGQEKGKGQKLGSFMVLKYSDLKILYETLSTKD